MKPSQTEELLEQILWELKGIREDLGYHGVGGRRTATEITPATNLRDHLLRGVISFPK